MRRADPRVDPVKRRAFEIGAQVGGRLEDFPTDLDPEEAAASIDPVLVSGDVTRARQVMAWLAAFTEALERRA